MLSLFSSGGPVMFLLLACSIGGVYIVVNKFLFFKFHFFQHEKTIEDVKDQLLTYGINESLLRLRTDRKIITKVLCNAIKLSSSSRDVIQDAFVSLFI